MQFYGIFVYQVIAKDEFHHIMFNKILCLIYCDSDHPGVTSPINSVYRHAESIHMDQNLPGKIYCVWKLISS